MRCPRCHTLPSCRVLYTRRRADGSIRRRHQCDSCQIRWTSFEDIAPGSIAPAPRPFRLPLQQDIA